MGRGTGSRKKSRHTEFVFGMSNVAFDDETMTISADVNHSSARQTRGIPERFVTPDHAGHALAREIFNALKKRAQPGMSWVTVRTYLKGVGGLVDSLLAAGIGSIDDLTVEALADLQLETAGWATLRATVARSNDTRLRAISHTLGMARRSSPDGRVERADDDLIDSLRAHCEQELEAAMKAQDALLKSLGFETANRAGWKVTADDVIERIRERDAARDEKDRVAGSTLKFPSVLWSAEQVLDWFLLHPEQRWTGVNHHPSFRKGALLSSIYPGTGLLSCLAALHALAENRGFNEATILGFRPQDLTLDEANKVGQIALTKARSHRRQIDGVSIEGKFTSIGGLLDFGRVLTRFNRRWHRQLVEADPEANGYAADLVYAPFTTELPIELATQASYLMTGHEPTVGFRQLRRYALYAGLKDNSGHDVAMHQPEQRDHYLRFALPTAVKERLTIEAHDEWATSVSFIGDEPPAVDVGLSSCENDGIAPDDSGAPCDLGPAACFACPHGYRTLAHLPLLKTTVDVAIDLAAVSSERAEPLIHLARLCTEQIALFPQSHQPEPPTEEERQTLRYVVGDLLLNWKEAS